MKPWRLTPRSGAPGPARRPEAAGRAPAPGGSQVSELLQGGRRDCQVSSMGSHSPYHILLQTDGFSAQCPESRSRPRKDHGQDVQVGERKGCPLGNLSGSISLFPWTYHKGWPSAESRDRICMKSAKWELCAGLLPRNSGSPASLSFKKPCDLGHSS